MFQIRIHKPGENGKTFHFFSETFLEKHEAINWIRNNQDGYPYNLYEYRTWIEFYQAEKILLERGIPLGSIRYHTRRWFGFPGKPLTDQEILYRGFSPTGIANRLERLIRIDNEVRFAA